MSSSLEVFRFLSFFFWIVRIQYIGLYDRNVCIILLKNLPLFTFHFLKLQSYRFDPLGFPVRDPIFVYLSSQMCLFISRLLYFLYRSLYLYRDIKKGKL